MTTDTRVTEKLLALLRYEMDVEHGVGSSELLDETLDWVRDILLNGDDAETYEKPTEDDRRRWRNQNVAMAEHIVAAMVASGHAAECTELVEHWAERRRECEAKFKMSRLVPFTASEEKSLTAAWNQSSADAAAERKAESQSSYGEDLAEWMRVGIELREANPAMFAAVLAELQSFATVANATEEERTQHIARLEALAKEAA
ncbi:MAG: hypothetical protein AB7O24_34335 [Kofleriaceae bacterium]